MAYTPPPPHAVSFNFTQPGYTPPGPLALVFRFGSALGRRIVTGWLIG